MTSNIFHILIIFCYFQHISCVDYQYDTPNIKPSNQEVSVEFPKYNIKIAPTLVKRPQVVLQEVELPSEEYHMVEETTQDENEEPEVYYVESEPIHVIEYNNEHMPPIVYHDEASNQPAYDYSDDYNQPLYILSQPVEANEQYTQSHAPYHQPIITREPSQQQVPHKINPEYLRNVQDFNEDVGLPRKHKNTWFYSAPNWNQNTASTGTILREADPRSIITSHTSFVKVKKPIFGSKVMFTNHKYIDTNHGHGYGGTNIHKNTHIHVHNRDANENDNNNEIIGSYLWSAPRWRRDSEVHTRPKRGLLDIATLIIDPKSKLDLQKTSENVGAATRNVFEEDYSPMFHLTNALGSAQDSFHSLLNVRPSGIFVPCSYRTVDANEAVSSPMVGAINPSIYNHQDGPIVSPIQDDGTPKVPDEVPQSQYSAYDSGGGDPLHLIGSKLRESVQWAQRSAQHAADAMHHVRNVFVTARSNWPKMMLPYAGALQVTRPQPGEYIVGTSRDPQYVGVGHMLDSLGMTDRKPDIVGVGGPRMISDEEMILQKAKNVLGAPTYKQFLDDMKRHLDFNSDIVGASRLRLRPSTDLQTKLALDRLRNALVLQKAKANLRRIQAPKLPIIPKPIIPQIPKIPKPNPILKAPSPTTNHLDKIREAIENLKPTTTTTKPETPLDILRAKLFQKYNIQNSGGDLLGKTLQAVRKQPETVGTPQKAEVPVPVLTKEMRTPFMGLATRQDLEKYFNKLYCNNCKMGDIK